MAYSMTLNAYASLIYRHGNRFYDRVLITHHIGCGQQFFLAKVDELAGITVLDLAKVCQFDKGTAARAVQKLEREGYLRSESDPRDMRVRRLYTTEAARPILEAVRAASGAWNSILTQGMEPEEMEQVTTLIARMAKNAVSYMAEEERLNEKTD